MRYPVVLNDAFKRFTLDQDKILTPEETVRRFKERLAGLDIDILKETVRIDNGRLGIPVYFSLCGKDAASVIGTRKQMGKGGTPRQAEASAVMELAERFSFFSFVKNPDNFFTEKHRNLSGKAIPFEMIARSVHDASEELDIAKKIFENLSLRWTRAFNLTRQQEILIPFDWFYAINQFNGPSAGNCVEEALSQGICEIVERHVSSIVSRNRMKTASIDRGSVSDPLTAEMIRKYEKTGIRLFISDFSLGLGIPSVGVLAYDPSTFPDSSEIVWTAGTTPDPQKALSRALTEVAQLAGDFNSGANYLASGLPKPKRLIDVEFVTEPEKTVSIKNLPDISNVNIRIEVENLISALAARKMETIVIDTTHTSLEIPAFYTIVPGAHFRERADGTSVGMFSAKIVSETLPPEAALYQLKRMDQMLPGKYYIRFYLGTCHLALDDPKGALPRFQEALSLAPDAQDVPSIYSYMGVALKEMGDYRQAIVALEAGKKFDTERTDIYNLLGFCRFKLKEHEAAIANFEEVLRLDPGSAIDYANIGSNYREMGDTERAAAYYRRALELDPSIDFARSALEKIRGQKSEIRDQKSEVR